MTDRAFPSIFALLSRPDGCAWWRVAMPFNALRAQGYPAQYGWMRDRGAQKLAHQFELVLMPRVGWQSIYQPGQPATNSVQVGREMLMLMHANGQMAITDVDDDIWVARHEQLNHAELGFPGLHQASTAENAVSTRMYDGITVSEQRLRTIVEQVAPETPVEVVPNAIDLQYWQGCIDQGKDWKLAGGKLDGKLVVGWAGGNRKDHDFDVLAEAWRRIARTHEGVQFVTLGHQAEPLANAVPEDRLHHVGWLPIQPADGEDKPPYPVGLSQIDIMCCSLERNRFNHAKSPIKAWEAGASGAAVVASSWVYGRTIEHGHNGYVADTADDWEWALSKMIRSKGTRRRLARRLGRTVREVHSLEHNLWRWPTAWKLLAEAAAERLTRRYSVLVPGGSW